VLLNNGSGVFANGAGSPYSTIAAAPDAVVTGPFAQNFFNDIVVGNETPTPGVNSALTLFSNNGSGVFVASQVNQGITSNPIAINHATALASGNINTTDNLPDLAVADDVDGKVFIVTNNFNGLGAGVFDIFSTISGFTSPHAVALGDFNGDSKLDL